MTIGVVEPWPLVGLPWIVMFTADIDQQLYFPAEARVEVRLKYGTVWRECTQSPLKILQGQHVRVTQRAAP